MATSSLKYYFYDMCPFARPTQYFLRTNNIAHEAIFVNIAKGEQKTPEFLSINPFGKVPTIVESDGFSVYESSSLLRYLCNTRDLPDHWYPKDPRKRVKVDTFFDWYQAGAYSFNAYVHKDIPSLRDFFPSIGDPLVNLEKSLTDMEKKFLGDNKFLTGDEISIADIQIIFYIANLGVVEYEIGDKFPKLKEWKERVITGDIKSDYDKYVVDATEYFDRLKK